MMIRTVTVTDVGMLRGPVGFSFAPGLNLVMGPNETGKSTLLHAIRTAFVCKYDSKADDARRLLPHGGGAPEIVMPFEPSMLTSPEPVKATVPPVTEIG